MLTALAIYSVLVTLALIFFLYGIGKKGEPMTNMSGERGLTAADVKRLSTQDLTALLIEVAKANGLRIIAKDTVYSPASGLADNTIKTTSYLVRKL